MSCETEKQGLGGGGCTPPRSLRGMIVLPQGVSFTEEELQSATALQAALFALNRNERAYLWPKFDTIEDQRKESVYQELVNNELFVDDGYYRYMAGISKSLCQHKAMFSHKNTTGRAIIFDKAGNIFVTELANGKFTGQTLGMLNVEPIKFSNGTDATMSMVKMVFPDVYELNQNGKQINASTWINSLVALVDVTVTIQAASDTEITVKVVGKCDEVEIEGIADEFFLLLDGDSETQTISSVAESGDGVYVLSGTGLVTGTLKVLSTSGYEGQAAVTIGS